MKNVKVLKEFALADLGGQSFGPGGELVALDDDRAALMAEAGLVEITGDSTGEPQPTVAERLARAGVSTAALPADATERAAPPAPSPARRARVTP